MCVSIVHESLKEQDINGLIRGENWQVITDEANGPGLQDAVFGNGQHRREDWVAKMTVLPGPTEQQEEEWSID